MMDRQLSNRFANMSLLCAILVVSIHIGRSADVGSIAWYFSQIVSSGIAGIAIPFFFFTSGYFLAAHCDEDGWWKHAVGKRCKTLLIPYLIWSVLFLAFDNAFCLLVNIVSHAELSRNLYWPGFWNLFGLNVFSHPGLFVMWYVRALFLLVLISPVIVWLLRKMGTWLLLPLFLVYVIVVPGDEADAPHWMLPLKWTFSLLGLFYFSLGTLVRMRGWSLSLNRYVTCVCLLVGGGALAMQVISRYFGFTYFISPRPFMVLFLAVAIFSLMPTTRLPTWLAGCAFPIYVLHCFCRLIPWSIIPNASTTLLGLFCTWVATVGLCICAARLMHKFIPKITALLFGGR